MKNNKYMENYDCAKHNLCDNCYWSTGEQCIRELLDEVSIQHYENVFKGIELNNEIDKKEKFE